MSKKKLHLGCGKRYLEGYIHLDLANHEHIDHHHDIKTLPMFDDNSIDLIYASHTLEYFDRVEVLTVLKEWRRVIKRGGVLRLAVPDFESMSNVYIRSNNLDLIIGPMYGRWQVPGGDQVFYHRTVYDFASLKNVLESARFSDIKRWDWRKVFVGELADFDDYSQAYIPHMDKENGILISLNVEAIKV